jgi:ABC-2 type transport system permease protein
MWLRVRVLIVKELLALMRDPRSRVVLVAPPLLQLVVFSFAATLEVKRARIAVLNRDYGTAARDLAARFEGSPYVHHVRHLRSVGEIAPAIDNGDVLMVLHVDVGFSRDLAAGRPAPVQLILDGRRSNSAQIMLGYSTAIVDRVNEELAVLYGTPRPPSVVVDRSWFNPNLDSIWNAVPSLVAILTALVGVVVTSLSVARERELGTFEQLLVSPLRPTEIIIGKTLPALLVGVTEGTVISLVGVYVFHVPFHGSALLLFLSLVVFTSSIVGVGLFISSLAKTQQQAFLGAFAFMVPAVLLSGYASPIENMPEWLQTATLLNPVRHFMVIVRGVFLKGLPTPDVLRSLWPMALIAVATLTAATWLFRRRME